MTDLDARRITIRRTASNVIEYEVEYPSTSPDYPAPEIRIFHANREVTFFGPHTGNPARQVSGAASTLWRETDGRMIQAFLRAYPGAHVHVSPLAA